MRAAQSKPMRGAVAAAVAIAMVSFGSSLVAHAQTELTGAATGIVLHAQPHTTTLPPRPALQQAFRAARQGNAIVALAVEGIEGATTQPVTINVFINKPDADRTTPVDDPHFVGPIVLLPRDGQVKPTGRRFDLSRAADLDPAAPLRVTLVPVVGTEDSPQPPRDLSLRIGKIYVRSET